jgi:Protein of unknown function (DUF3050)
MDTASTDEGTTREMIRYEARLHARLEPLGEALAQHAIYNRVNDIRSLRIFMKSHVFAVWDFMSLLKTLQRTLTCVDIPWLPPSNIHAARLINTIVLGEETDEVAPGEYTSHFDLYLKAMDELDADRAPIDEMITAVRGGQPVDEALQDVDVPPSTRDFVRTTMHIAGGSVHEVASSFLHGREDLVPMMFRRILGGLASEPSLECLSFRRYLERHVDVDEGEHGPMARQLLRALCGADEEKWEQAAEAAAVGLRARLELWDGVLEQLDASKSVASSTLRPPCSSSRVKLHIPAASVGAWGSGKRARRAAR